jgi:hypothetical protein
MHTLVRVKNAYTVMTICLIALGAALLFAPQLGLRTLCVVYGVFLIVYGVTKLSGYFAKDLFQLAFQFDLALGIVSIVLGIIIIEKSEYIIEILSTAIGIFMLVERSRYRPQWKQSFGIERWWLILVMSFVVAFVGILLLVTPFETAGMIVRLIGLNLSLDGILNLFVVRNTVETIRRNTKWEI